MSINLLTHQWAEEMGLKSQFFPEITSTNDVAKAEFADSGEDFCLYSADHQSQGRGRNSNSWQNLSNGEILLSTWCFKVLDSPQPILTPLLGLSLYQALQSFDPSLPLRLKAPNDIYLNEAKLAGLLVEVISQGKNNYVLIGLGMNVLAKPQVELSTSSLSEHIENPTALWSGFCTELLSSFSQAIKEGTKSQLHQNRCDEILAALNSGLTSDKAYTSVSPNCDLHTPSGTIQWMDL